MIGKYSVNNFKIHKDSYEFNMEGLTLFTGTNNSGKTSIIQSLRVLSKVNNKSLNYTRLPLEDIPELMDISRTLNKTASRSESITYKLSLDLDTLKFCNIEIEFNSPYNYETVFFDMLDQAILYKIDIYFENKDGLIKNYEFVINLERIKPIKNYKYTINVDEIKPITYSLNEIMIDNEGETNLIQADIMLRGLFTSFIPKKLEAGLADLLVVMSELGRLDETKIDYLPALRSITNTAETINQYKDKVIFDGITKFSEAFDIWTNKMLKSEFRVKIDGNKPKIVAVESGIDFELNQIGFGNTQIIPIIVLILKAKKGDLIIIENPEIHLHPKWKTDLIELFYYAVNNGINILIETQSMEMINRVRVTIKNNKSLADKTSLYFFKKLGLESSVQNIKIEETGNLEVWPNDFLDKVTLDDSFRLL